MKQALHDGLETERLQLEQYSHRENPGDAADSDTAATAGYGLETPFFLHNLLITSASGGGEGRGGAISLPRERRK